MMIKNLACSFDELRSVKLETIAVGGWFRSMDGRTCMRCETPSGAKREDALWFASFDGPLPFSLQMYVDKSNPLYVLRVPSGHLRITTNELVQTHDVRESAQTILEISQAGPIVGFRIANDAWGTRVKYRLIDGKQDEATDDRGRLWSRNWSVCLVDDRGTQIAKLFTVDGEKVG